MKKYIKLSLLFLIILLIANSVCADGWHISDQQLHLYEPNQKAVISWDGTTETMILASAVKSNNIANFAWVVPIQSYSKPEVTAGNISIFEDLVDYFKKPSKKLEIMGTLSADFSGVNILETKEIDVYDITILEATNSNDLINWLNNNGYKVPEEAKPILDKYVAKGNFYFVANKIDLTNLYSSEILRDKIIDASNLYNRGCLNEFILRNTTTHIGGLSGDARALGRAIFAENKSFESFDISFSISKEKFTEIKNKYKTIRVSSKFPDPIWNYQNSIKLINFDCCIKKTCNMFDMFSGTYSGACYELEDDMIEFYETIAKPFLIEFRKFYDKFEDSYIDYDQYEEELNILCNNRREVKDKLRLGMATPLKFIFQPNNPYYPLEISSLNLGESIIEVYILTSNPVIDQNKILVVEESKEIDSELRTKLENQINLANAKYVTRLSYKGNLKDLNADAKFKEKYNFLQSTWNWISNLFE